MESVLTACSSAPSTTQQNSKRVRGIARGLCRKTLNSSAAQDLACLSYNLSRTLVPASSWISTAPFYFSFLRGSVCGYFPILLFFFLLGLTTQNPALMRSLQQARDHLHDSRNGPAGEAWLGPHPSPAPCYVRIADWLVVASCPIGALCLLDCSGINHKRLGNPSTPPTISTRLLTSDLGLS